MIVVQMHGDPGSGKSTLADGLGRALPAIVMDKDAIASPLLNRGVPNSAAGPMAYEVMHELASDLLASGHSVVLDSPCAWPMIEERGRALAVQFGVPWLMIELTCPETVIDRRLANRSARRSNPTHREDWYARPGSYRPACERLVVDGTRPLDELVEEALAYLRAGQAHPAAASPSQVVEGEGEKIVAAAVRAR